jgi:hypothetical protein
MSGDSERSFASPEDERNIKFLPSTLKARTSPFTILNVGGAFFCLEKDDIESLKSDFLSSLTDPGTNFSKPGDGVFCVDADPESFSAILHFTRYGTLPAVYDIAKTKLLVEQADFWGVKEQIKKGLDSEKKSCAGCIRCTFDHRRTLECNNELEAAKKHHNIRKDDGGGRIYCTDCNCQDFACLCFIYVGSKYATCAECNKGITFKHDLNWCHKCRMCVGCQKYHCPMDNSYLKATTQSLQADFDALIKEPKHFIP